MTSFHPFPRLPAELRLAIWEFAVEPRVLKVHRTRQSRQMEAINQKIDLSNGSFRPKADDSSVVLMAVCHEAREHLEKVYAKVNLNKFARNGAYMWFNPRIDTIHIEWDQLEYLVPQPEARLIQVLIVEISSARGDSSWQTDLRNLDDTLKTVIVSCDAWKLHEYHDWDRDDDDAARQEQLEAGLEDPKKEMDEDWTSSMCQVFAPLYWRCKPAPFHTKSYCPNDSYLEEITEHNYVEKERASHIQVAHREKQHTGAADDAEHYINNADAYWKWQHHDCQCEDKNENLGQRLLDVCIAKHPIDVAIFD